MSSLNWRRITVALSGHCWRNIPIARFDLKKDEQMAQAQRTEKVTVLDVAGSIASAKLITPGWVDYMTLSKINGEWKILSVVQRIDN